MGKAEKKHPLTQILAVGVLLIIIAGVLSLLTTTALAFDDAKCESWAKEIKARVEDISNDPGFEQGVIRNNSNCPNLCANEQDGNDLRITPFLRKPVGVLAATITEILTSSGDKFFGGFQQGITAFFCVVPQTDPNNFTEVIVAAGHHAPTDCGTGWTEICRTSLSLPVPID
jgi:hypothetical protein